MYNTPMMQQYQQIKSENPGAVLFFRMGDFYEMFLDDALEISQQLDLTLTQRQGVPMCGIPHHSATNYLRRLLAKGYKIAICEQFDDGSKERSLMQRRVVETLTPGTVVDESFLEQRRNNYLLALTVQPKLLAIAFIDLSTGEFVTAQQPLSEHLEIEEAIRYQLMKLDPREILLAESMRKLFPVEEHASRTVNFLPNWHFDQHRAYEKLCGHFNISSLKGFGFQDQDAEITVAGVILDYISDNCPGLQANITNIKKYNDANFLQFDSATLRNLEIVRNLQDNGAEYTLIKVMNLAQTAMGSRCLQRWLLHPLSSRDQIEERLDLVEQLQQTDLAEPLLALLKGSPDLERLSGRVSTKRAHARDLLALARSLHRAVEISQLLENKLPLAQLFTNCPAAELKRSEQRLTTALHPSPPLSLSEGNLIADGFDHELDQLRQLKNNQAEILTLHLEEERKLTGISTLKLKNNRMLGYFFEVSKSNQREIPEHFIRRQSLVNGERFTSLRLIELEEQLAQAEEKLIAREQLLFLHLREQLRQQQTLLQSSASALAELDALLALARRALISNYTRPSIHLDQRLLLKEGRHPVVEHYLDSGQFINNSLQLDEEKRFILLTGPNMAGKSTFLRQSALIVYLAQCGSFVPASHAEIGLVDRLFCRVGASDNLARGESTFLIEMQESARILNLAGKKSLVIMDEVGRGTSTEDGLALACSISEYLLNQLGSRTLFATHYHELTRIEHPNLLNLSMAVDDSQRPILFLKKVQPGAALCSYGLHVAALAGVPSSVIARAEQLLNSTSDQETSLAKISSKAAIKSLEQSAIPTVSLTTIFLQELAQIDLDQLTPLAALQHLTNWKKRLTEKSELLDAASL